MSVIEERRDFSGFSTDIQAEVQRNYSAYSSDSIQPEEDKRDSSYYSSESIQSKITKSVTLSSPSADINMKNVNTNKKRKKVKFSKLEIIEVKSYKNYNKLYVPKKETSEEKNDSSEGKKETNQIKRKWIIQKYKKEHNCCEIF